MTRLTEDAMTFVFPDGWSVSKYDEWTFYRNHFQKVANSKAIDFLAIEPGTCCWFIEVKDYRQHPRTKVSELADEIAVKVRDSLAGLVAAQLNATVEIEKAAAKLALRSPRLKVVLHLEQPMHPSRFHRAIDPADIQQKLRQIIKGIDAHPVVVEKSQATLWSVQ